MKIFAIVIIVFLGSYSLWVAYKSDLKDEHINELEREVWDLKLQRHTDSLVQASTANLKKKLDSMFTSR